MPETYNYNQNSGQQPMYNPPQYQPQAGMEPPPGYVQKSRVAAGILAILLGTYGIHSFYLGNTSRGLLQLLLSLFTCLLYTSHQMVGQPPDKAHRVDEHHRFAAGQL